MSLYPSATLCFANKFKEDILQKHGRGINGSSYFSFLQGTHWDERMLNINYENVTTNLQDYVVRATAYYSEMNGTNGFREVKLRSFKELGVIKWLRFYQCLTFDMPKYEKDELKFGSNLPEGGDVHQDRKGHQQVHR